MKRWKNTGGSDSGDLKKEKTGCETGHWERRGRELKDV